MAQYPASGILFKNDRKQNERQPDYTGNIEMDKELVTDLWNQLQEGVEHPKANLVGWRKMASNGNPFLSLRSDLLRDRKENGGYQSKSNNNQTQGSVSNDMDDEIPF